MCAIFVAVTAGTGMVGVRYPSHPIAQKLLKEAKVGTTPCAARGAGGGGGAAAPKGLVVTKGTNIHANLDFLLRRFPWPPRLQTGLDMLVPLLVATFFVFFTFPAYDHRLYCPMHWGGKASHVEADLGDSPIMIMESSLEECKSSSNEGPYRF
jgi:hypothetical protein